MTRRRIVLELGVTTGPLIPVHSATRQPRTEHDQGGPAADAEPGG